MAAYPRVPPAVHQLVSVVSAPTSALSTMDGQVPAGGIAGLYVGDLRVLDRAVVLVDGEPPEPLTHWTGGPGRVVFASVLRRLGDAGFDPTVRLDRARRLHPDGMTERLTLTNTAVAPLEVSVDVLIGADLTPLESVRHGGTPTGWPATLDARGLIWSNPVVTVVATAPGARLAEDGVHWSVKLAPGACVTLEWSLRVATRRPLMLAPDTPPPWRVPVVRTGDRRLDLLVAQSLDDLDALRLIDPGGTGASPDDALRPRLAPVEGGEIAPDTFIAAGVPWFLTLFGRDSLWAARMLLPLGTELAAGTLRTLARRQGRRVDPESGEAPGKIMHELRAEDSRVGVPGLLPATYYGTVDATLLWISLLHDAWRWGLSTDAVEPLLPHLRAALQWMADHADPDGDGFLEYRDDTGQGLANQGWKDSGTAIQFRDGRLAVAPIALCEVQGYAHRAALDAADLLEAFGEPGAASWRGYAARLNERFRARFWVDNDRGRYPALALDADKRPVDALTSNIGHLLGSGLLDAQETRAVVAALGREELAGGYGLRTMATGDAGYAPLAYHCGGVWPHDTAIVVTGLARLAAAGDSGAGKVAASLIDGLLRAAAAFDYRLPELYGGDARTPRGRPLPHPGACHPQAWAAAASIAVLQAALGIAPDVPRGRLVVRPLLGGPLGDLEVAGLSVAGAPVEVRVSRNGRVEVTGAPGGLVLELPDGDSRPLPAQRGAAEEQVRQ